MNSKMDSILKHCEKQIPTMINALKTSFKGHIDNEVKKVVQSFSNDIPFQNISFDAKHGSFLLKEEFNNETLLTDLFSKT